MLVKVPTCPRPGWIQSRMDIRAANILQKKERKKGRNPHKHPATRPIRSRMAQRRRRRAGRSPRRRGTDLEQQKRSFGPLETLPRSPLRRPSRALAAIPSTLHNYAPLRESGHRVLINRRPAELSSGAATDFRKDLPFLPGQAGSAEYLAMQIDGPPPSSFPTAGSNHEVGGRQPPPA